VVLNFGEFSDLGVDYRPLGGPFISNFQQFHRTADHNPPDSGQYGMNFKYYLPNFNNGTELGLYFLNYHSRVPVVSFRTGTQAGVANAFGALTAVGGAAQALAAGLPYAAAIATGAQAGAGAAARVGGNLSAAVAQQYATVGANTLLAGGDVTGQATNIATNEYAQTAGYFDEYPKDIKMLGVSFNTQLQKTGVALQGEFTYRHGVPLQFDDVELVYAALTPFEAGIAQLRNTPLPSTCLPGAGATLSRCNQIGAFGPGQVVRGYGLYDTYQAQFTATKSVANILKASQLVLVFESAVDWIPGLPDKLTGGPAGRGLRLDSPGTNVSGNAALAGVCDVLIATEDASIGMGGPAMIAGGGLGDVAPGAVGPMAVQVPNGVVDLLVLQMFGVASAFMAIMVLGLYLNSAVAETHYRFPAALWAVGPALLLWRIPAHGPGSES